MVLQRPSPCVTLFDFFQSCGGIFNEEIACHVMRKVVEAANSCCSRGVRAGLSIRALGPVPRGSNHSQPLGGHHTVLIRPGSTEMLRVRTRDVNFHKFP
ncbi:hypothetical protein PO909_023863 [Leuciscus waleckii]